MTNRNLRCRHCGKYTWHNIKQKDYMNKGEMEEVFSCPVCKKEKTIVILKEENPNFGIDKNMYEIVKEKMKMEKKTHG